MRLRGCYACQRPGVSELRYIDKARGTGDMAVMGVLVASVLRL